MLTSLLLFFLFLLSLYLWKSFFSGSPLPGPLGLPVVGNLFSLLKNPSRKLAEWSKTYGRTVGVHLGSRLMVVIHDPDLAKSLLSDENTTGRDHNFIIADFFKGKGLLLSEGDLWKEQRRFALTSLRNLGMGKSWLEDAILAEIAEVMKTFEKSSAAPHNPRPHLTLSVSNIICALVFGKRFEHSDAKFIRLCGLLGQNVVLIADLIPVQAFPWLKKVPFVNFQKKLKLFSENFYQIKTFGLALIEQHTINKDDDSEDKEDFINGFLLEQDKQISQHGSQMNFDNEQLLFTVLNLFVAGTETTTSSLLWSFIFMVQYPEVQRKVQAEIDVNIGRDRPIRTSDKGFLKYTEATILDVQRLASIVPLSVSHTNFLAMKIDNFDVPARSLININTYAIHHDTKFWEKPFDLHPQHFLDAAGNIAIPKAFLPFGVGKRACAGESLAKMELLLFFSNILQKFTIEGDLHTLPAVDDVPAGLVRSPPPYNIRFIPRL